MLARLRRRPMGGTSKDEICMPSARPWLQKMQDQVTNELRSELEKARDDLVK